MRISSMALAACAAALMVSGCTTQESMAKEESPFLDNVDYVKINRIEAQAFQGGHSVTWIHLPTKKYASRSERVGIN